jgi:hypothetical protein
VMYMCSSHYGGVEAYWQPSEGVPPASNIFYKF